MSGSPEADGSKDKIVDPLQEEKMSEETEKEHLHVQEEKMSEETEKEHLHVESRRTSVSSASSGGTCVSSVHEYAPNGNIPISSEVDGNIKIPINTIYSPPSSFVDFYLPNIPAIVKITDAVETRRSHVLNPVLYTIEITHGKFSWSVQKRFRHFKKLQIDLILYKARHPRLKAHVPKLPKVPDATILRPARLEKRRLRLQKFLQKVLYVQEFRQHAETLNFFEVSSLSFLEDLGLKSKEGRVRKRAGGHRFNRGILSMLRCYHCVTWKTRWLILKDSFIAYLNPKNQTIRDVLLIDTSFTVTCGRCKTGVSSGLWIANESRHLRLESFTRREAREWMTSIVKHMAGPGADWIKDHHHESFAPCRKDTQVQWFVDGRDHFAAVAEAIERAEEEIFITDWWLTPELHLKRPVDHYTRWRLDVLLKKKADSGVKVYVLLYKELEMTLSINSLHSKQVLQRLHGRNIKVMRHPDHVPGSGTFLWAHHEKIVCIDQKIAFIGGIDLCLGRWDDHTHRLTDFGSAQPNLFSKLETNIFNVAGLFLDTGMTQQKTEDSTDSGDLSGTAKYFIGKDYSNPFIKDFEELDKPFEDSLDRKVHMRMPWHDISSIVYGACARDVARHFIQRWNVVKHEKAKKYTEYALIMPRSYDSLEEIEPINPMETVKADCQILRSSSKWSAGISTEKSIQNAYVESITNAKHFIYIENQFFITSLISDGVCNGIGDALVTRILKAHKNEEKFKVFVVMPLLPSFPGEIGKDSGSAICAVEHWNLRSITRSPESIIQRLKANGVEDPSEYISVCGLRTYEDLGSKLVTEIVYVHSKLMIVDDRVTIIGSANINDRSMLGDRDSEMAIFVKDCEMVDSQMNGECYSAGSFAHALRVHLFKEHLGLLDDPYCDVNDPVRDETYKDLWQATAKANTEIYDEIFCCIPNDSVKSFADVELHKKCIPLAVSDTVESRKRLRDVKGNLVEKPLAFLENQDMRPSTGTAESLVSYKVFT